MDNIFVNILQKLVTEQGKEALLNPTKCKAFLADYTKGEYKKESRLLLQAVETGVSKAIDSTNEIDICKKQQIRVLQDEYFLTDEIASDVVDTLAFVLRGYKAKSKTETQKPEIPKTETPQIPSYTPVKQTYSTPMQTPPKKKLTNKHKFLLSIATVVFLILLFYLFYVRYPLPIFPFPLIPAFYALCIIPINLIIWGNWYVRVIGIVLIILILLLMTAL